MDGRVVDLGHLDQLLFNHDLWYLDCLLDHLWLWNFDCNFNGILNDPLLSLDDRDMDNLLLLVRHVDVNVVVNVDVVVAVLARDRRNVDDLLLHHGNWNVSNLLDHLLHLPNLRNNNWHLHNFLLLVRHVDVNVVINVNVVVAILPRHGRHMDDLTSRRKLCRCQLLFLRFGKCSRWSSRLLTFQFP
jgi:hypothetical protein